MGSPQVFSINWLKVRRLICFLIPVLICSILISSCQDHHQSASYHSKIALSKPVLFSNDITTTNGIAFSKNGETLFISSVKADIFSNGRSTSSIFTYQFLNDEWVGPTPLELTGALDAYHPVLSANNDLLFFNSRSHPDSADKYLKHDIWYVKKESSETWAKPENIHQINTEYYESYPSVSRNGNLYFNSDRPGGKGGMDIYVSRFENGTYQTPEALMEINSIHEENDLVIDPEERFIIFNRYIHADRSIDMWISYNRQNQWTVPVRLDQINSPDAWELTPTISPDGNYFFYEKNNQIWQIDLSVLIDQQLP